MDVEKGGFLHVDESTSWPLYCCLMLYLFGLRVDKRYANWAKSTKI